jgi:hypothetical protein
MPAGWLLDSVALVVAISLLRGALAAPVGHAQTPIPSSPSRLALVIGNSAYEVGRLRNPVNDANDMAAALRDLGFEVTLLTDVKHPEMRQAIRDFGRRLGRGGISVFYFAGHGVQVDGENYLIPVGAGIEVQEEVRFNAVPQGFVLDWMGDALGAGRLNLVLLDACRNNPFPARNRSPTRGLAATRPPSGTLIAYAASPGEVAEDGGPGERNGRFTKHLLRALAVPGLTIEQVVKRTVTAVVAETGQHRGEKPRPGVFEMLAVLAVAGGGDALEKDHQKQRQGRAEPHEPQPAPRSFRPNGLHGAASSASSSPQRAKCCCPVRGELVSMRSSWVAASFSNS